SPSYAGEIMQPSDPVIRGFSGGEGLDAALRGVHAEGRLHGILNGCDYPNSSQRAERARNLSGKRSGALPDIRQWSDFLAACSRELSRWAAQKPVLRSSHFVAGQRVSELASRSVLRLLTSVTRVTDQKVKLLLQSGNNGRSALDNLLDALGDDGLYVLLGSGQGDFEHALTQVAAERDNFLFLNGYSDAIANALYSRGDLFLMPSSFEPCGISQMIAMRHGQPCLVHGVGGLRDTVTHGRTGFVFSGENLIEQADNFVHAAVDALNLQRGQPERWREIKSHAAAERFTWDVAAKQYKAVLYAPAPSVILN
ncbi:MAG: glycosyltransferase, partial [Pseudomonadota bacterium]